MATTAEEIANPWLLLKRTFEDGAIAAIADQTTLMYVLHLGVGDDFTFTPDGQPARSASASSARSPTASCNRS